MHTGLIPSAALNVSVGTSALPSGAATDNSILSMRVREDVATVNGQYLMGTSAVVRQDTLASLVGTSGDNTQMSVDANGALYNISPTANALLTTIDEDTNAIKTSVQLLDNAVDGNFLNVNANIAGTDVDSNSGNKSAATQRVVIATDDINLAAIKTSVQLIDNAIDGSEMQVDIVASLPAGTNAIGKLAANSGVDIGDVDVASLPLTFNSGNKDGTCQRVVIATDDVNLSAIKTSVQLLDNAISGNEMQVDIVSSSLPSGAATESSLAAVNGKITICNTGAVVLAAGSASIGKLAANSGVDIGDVDVTSLPLTFNSGNKDGTCQRVVIATDDVNLSAIKTAVETIDNAISGNEMQVDIVSGPDTIAIAAIASAAAILVTKTTLATTSELKTLLSGVTVNAGAQSSQFDTENYDKIRFFGETTAAVGNNISLMGSNSDGGTFYHLGESLRDQSVNSTHYIYGANIENLPRYIKIINTHGSTNFVFTKLFMQLSSGRLAV